MIRWISAVILLGIILGFGLCTIAHTEEKFLNSAGGYTHNIDNFKKDDGCPQIESDMIECPQDPAYEESSFNAYTPPKQPVYMYREDYSPSDRQKLFRTIIQPKDISNHTINKMFQFIKEGQ